MNPATCLARLEKIKTVFDEKTAVQRLSLLITLDKKRLTTSKQVQRLHNALCFIYAYPDNEQIFLLADSMLGNFAHRSDLRKHRKVLTNSGIAGTTIDYQFFWPMTCWLAKQWPGQLQLLWQQIDAAQSERLLKILALLLPFNESTAFDEYDYSPRQWLHRLKGTNETDAYFYTSRLSACFGNDFERESIHDEMNLTYRLISGPTTPTVATTRYQQNAVVYQTCPLNQSRDTLKTCLRECQFSIQLLSVAEGKILVDLARSTMVTHERDLDAFSYGNPADVRVIDFGDGYQTVCIGVTPERRYLIHATYGFLNLKNGLPIGYFPLSTAFNSADVAFNLFSAFRGGEAALVYTRNMAVAHQHFGVKTFIVDPYQLGYNNNEGLKSGVWWFYYKLGFRPTDKRVCKILRKELVNIKRTAAYRSSVTTLNELASANMYFNIENDHADFENLAALSSIAPGISAYLSGRFGAARELGAKTCTQQLAEMTRVDINKLNSDEKRMWHRWSPLLMNLGDIEKWSRADRSALVSILSAKARQRESDYLALLNDHARLKSAILEFAHNSSLLLD